MALALTSSTPELGRLVQPRALGRWTYRAYSALKPQTLYQILKQLEDGKLEDWVDLRSYMLRTDAHLQSVYETRILGVAGATWTVEPGDARPGQEMIADVAAELCGKALERVEQIERLWSDMLDATGTGWAFAEHNWYRADGIWWSSPAWIHPREGEFAPDWTLQVRDAKTGQWVRLNDHPGKFIQHVPRNLADSPNMTGSLLTVAWQWLFKRWCEKYMMSGLEKFANPFLYGEVPPNAPGNVRAQLLSDLEQLSADQVAVFETGTGIKIQEASQKVGDAWVSGIEHYDKQMTIGILGSLDNINAEGGSYARAESQAATTILPRLMSDAKRLAGTIERDWFKYICKYNAHLFDGQIPPTPKLRFQIVKDTDLQKPIEEFHLRGKLVRRNEVRNQLGLDALAPEEGGEELLDEANPAAVDAYGALYNPDLPPDSGQTAQVAPAGGTATASPLARPRQIPLPWTTTPKTTSQITSDSALRLKRALEQASVSQANLSHSPSFAQSASSATIPTSSRPLSKPAATKRTRRSKSKSGEKQS